MISQQHARYLVVLIFALVIGTIVSMGNHEITGYEVGAPMAEATSISSCTNLTSANTEYQLTANVGANRTCFNVTANNVTLDGNGFLINYSQAGGNDEYGVYSTANFTTVKNAIIIEGKVAGSDDYAVYLVGANNGTIKNNNITTSGSSGHGLSLLNSQNENITNNNITTSGLFSDGIYLESSSNSTLTRNNISSIGHGIYLYLSSNSTLRENAIAVSGTEQSGIIVGYGSNNNIHGNLIRTGDCACRGIYLETSSPYSILASNDIISDGTGISISSNSNFTIVTGNNATSSESGGINIVSSSGNNVSWNLVNSSGFYGIYISQSPNNVVANTVVTSNSTEGVRISDSDNNIIKNSALVLIGTILNDTYLESGSSNNTFLNVTYSTEYAQPSSCDNGEIADCSALNQAACQDSLVCTWSGSCSGDGGTCGNIGQANCNSDATGGQCSFIESSQLIRQWYLDVNATSAGAPLQNANVTAWNVTGRQVFSELSVSNGVTTKSLNDYVNNGGTKTYASNYTVNVTYSGFTTATTQVNISKTNNTRLNMVLTDIASPAIALHNITTEYPNRVSVLFNFTDNVATDSFSINDTTNWQINKTGYLQNKTNLNAVTYWINVSANDTVNNTASVAIWANITSTTTTTVAATTTTTSGGGGSRITTTSTVTATTTETPTSESVSSTIPPLTTIQIAENMSFNSSQMVSWEKLAEMVSNNVVKPVADVFAPKPFESIVVTESGNNVTITDLKSVDKKGIDKMVLVYENNTLIDEVYCSNVTVCRWIRDFEKRSEQLSYKLFVVSATGSVTEKAFDIARFGHPDAQGVTGEKLFLGMRLSATWFAFTGVLVVVFFFIIRTGYHVFLKSGIEIHRPLYRHAKKVKPGKLFKPAGYDKVKSSVKTNTPHHKSGKKHR